MNLFKYENNTLIIDPKAYHLIPFKTVWDRDKTKSKETATDELLYVWYMADYKSDFSDILDEDDRSKEIIKVLSLKKGWKPDAAIVNAIKFYKERRDGMAMRMLDSAKILASKIEKFCRTVDLTERDRSNKPIHKVSDLNNVLKQFGTTVESLNKLESQVKKEVSESKSSIGSRTKNIYEDGI